MREKQVLGPERGGNRDRHGFALAGLGTNSLPALLENMGTNPWPTHPDPIDLLMAVALHDPHSANRSGTVAALLQSPASRQTLPSLVQGLSDPDPAIRALAKEALAKFAPEALTQFINSTGRFAVFAEKVMVVVAETAPGKLNYEIGFAAIQSGTAMGLLRSDRPWFIYPSAPGAVWIFDGDRELNLFAFSNQTITASSSLARPDLPWRAPPEVVARLPQEMKAR